MLCRIDFKLALVLGLSWIAVGPLSAEQTNAPTSGTVHPTTSTLTHPVVPPSSASYFDVNNRSVLPANTESPLKAVSVPDGLDLQECFRLTAVRSDTLLISAQDVEVAQAQLAQTIAQLFPTVSFVSTHTFQHYKNASGGSFSNSGTGSSGSGSGQKDYTTSTGIGVSQTIFNGFSNYNSVGAARAGVAADKYNLQRNYQTLYQGVAQAFYQILSYEGDLVILADSVKALDARAKDLEERVRIGRSRPAELLQAQSDLAGTRVTIEETKGALAVTRETMAYYLGKPADQIKLKETQTFPSPQQFERYMKETGTRPDILALVESERQAQRNLSVAKGALFPTVTANGTYNLASDPSSNQEWYIGFEISLPLFDGGLILSRIREQKALVRQSEFNLDNLRRTADQDVRSAYASFNSSVAQYVRLHEEVELAALSYNAQASDYRAGIVSNLDVLVALNNLQSARRNLNSADLTARLNLINLHVAAGTAARTLSGTPAEAAATTKDLTDKKAKP